VEDAIRGGADALAMAGGDGSQAVVAAAAAAHELPYACIPAGTRNHFALDLGVDRNDVVGALDAFVDGRERLVDLAAVNGRTFVNNVSLGFYAEAVARKGYRHAKIRTMLDTAPDALGSTGSSGSNGLRWEGPDGRPRSHAAILMVSNDSYRLGGAVGAGTRPRLDAGVLGIAAITHVRGRARLEEWSAADFEIRADEQIPAGIDGESVKLDPPLVFESRPGVLRARIASGHAGASPSAGIPENGMAVLRRLVRLAFGRGSKRT
jgi:diacylglycerol kinase family enzyme